MQALKSITGTGPVVSQTKQQAAKQLAKNKVKPDLHVGTRAAITVPTTPVVPPVATPAKPATPAKGSVKSMTPEQLAAEVDTLKAELKACTDADEKKRIRRKLRLRGHFGGLGERVVKEKDISDVIRPATAPTTAATK